MTPKTQKSAVPQLEPPRLETSAALHIAGLRFTPETRNQIAALWKQYIPRLATLSSRVGRNAPAPAHAHVPDFFERYSEEFNAQTGTAGMEVWVSVKS